MRIELQSLEPPTDAFGPHTKLEIVYSADVGGNSKKAQAVDPAGRRSSLVNVGIGLAVLFIGAILTAAFTWLVDERIEAKTGETLKSLGEAVQSLGEDMGFVKGQLNVLLAKLDIAEASALPAEALAGRLVQVRHAIEDVQQANLGKYDAVRRDQVPVNNLATIKTNLASVPKTPQGTGQPVLSLFARSRERYRSFRLIPARMCCT